MKRARQWNKNIIYHENSYTKKYNYLLMDIFNIDRKLDRLSDINKRGYDCLVYDYDNSVVKLKDAKIWYSNNYVEPKLYHAKSDKKEITIKYCFFC